MLRVLDKTSKAVVRSLQKTMLKDFVLNTRSLIAWNCVPLLVTTCCYIPGVKNLSAVRHGISVKRPSVRCVVTADSITSCQMVSRNFLKVIKLDRRDLLWIQKNFIAIFRNDTEVAEQWKRVVESSGNLFSVCDIAQSGGSKQLFSIQSWVFPQCTP